MSKKHKIGAALVLVALVAWAGQAWAVDYGNVIEDSNIGREATTTTNAVAVGGDIIFGAPNFVVGDTGYVTLSTWVAGYKAAVEPNAKYYDTYTVPSIQVAAPAGSTGRVILTAGNPNPTGVVGNSDIPPGANNSVLAQIYSAGTANGATPTRAQLEGVWSQIQAGFYNKTGITYTPPGGTLMTLGQGNGITTTAPGASPTGTQRIAEFVKTDARGASYIMLIKDLKGDVDGNFKVNLFDVAAMAPNIDQSAASKGFGKFTWKDGDMDGNGVVNLFDVADLAPLIDSAAYNPGGGSGFAEAQVPSGGEVPEPSTIALFLAGALCCLLTGLRRFVR